MQPIVGAQHGIVGDGGELSIEHGAERVSADSACDASRGKGRRQTVIAVPSVFLLLDESRVLQQAQMAGYT